MKFPMVNFFRIFEFQDLDLSKTIDSIEACLVVYLLKVDSTSSQAHKVMSTGQCQNNSLSCFNFNKDSEIMLYHYRLDHPSFLYLQKPVLFKNKSSKRFSCEVMSILETCEKFLSKSII